MLVLAYEDVFNPDDGDIDEPATIVTNRSFARAVLQAFASGYLFLDAAGDEVTLPENESELIESGLQSVSSALNA